MTDKAQREIRKIAYALWMEDGQPEGRDREHWEAAKAIWTFRNREAAHGDDEAETGKAGHAARSSGHKSRAH